MSAPRPQWKGFLKLSLVTCPIALYPAITDAHKVSFRQVNRRTGHRLRQQLVDSVTGEAVESLDKGRGYEIGAHQFLMVEDHELEAARTAAAAVPARPSAPQAMEPPQDAVPELPPAAKKEDRTIEVERFVPRAQIDPAFYDKAYYIAPREPVGQEAFALVRDAMREKGMVALGHVTLSRRQRPIAIETYGKGMRGFVLRHRHDVRSEADYFSDISELELPADMLAVARHILEVKTGDFDPAFLEDRYHKALVHMLRRKQADAALRGPKAPSQENVVNLMDALKRSIAAEGQSAALKPSPRRAPAPSIPVKRSSPRRRKNG